MSKTEVITPTPVPTRIDLCVAEFVIVRDEIEKREEKHKLELRRWRDRKEKLEGELQAIMEELGLKSAKTLAGTATIRVTYSAPLSDPDLFMTFVRTNDAYELMDRRANSTACRAYAEEHNGELPPGVKLNQLRKIGVTRA